MCATWDSGARGIVRLVSDVGWRRTSGSFPSNDRHNAVEVGGTVDGVAGRDAGRLARRFVGRRVEERVLRREVAVDRRDGDAAAPRHLGHRDVARAGLGDEFEDGGQDPLPRHLSLQITHGHEMTISY